MRRAGAAAGNRLLGNRDSEMVQNLGGSFSMPIAHVSNRIWVFDWNFRSSSQNGVTYVTLRRSLRSVKHVREGVYVNPRLKLGLSNQ